jgi:hypothetical protein
LGTKKNSMKKLVWILELLGKLYFIIILLLIVIVGIVPFGIIALIVKIIDNIKYLRNEIETMRNGDHQYGE